MKKEIIIQKLCNICNDSKLWSLDTRRYPNMVSLEDHGYGLFYLQDNSLYAGEVNGLLGSSRIGNVQDLLMVENAYHDEDTVMFAFVYIAYGVTVLYKEDEYLRLSVYDPIDEEWVLEDAHIGDSLLDDAIRKMELAMGIINQDE